MVDDILALANSVCVLGLSRSGRHVLALVPCAGLIAPCCAVFAVDARRQRARRYSKDDHKDPSLGKVGFSRQSEKNGKRLAGK